MVNRHRQTLLIGLDEAKLRYANKRMAQSTESVEQLTELLQSVQEAFGRHSTNAAVLLKLLSDLCFDLGHFAESIEFAKQNILILDKAKCSGSRSRSEYINLHLQIALIAEKREDHSLGLRFLNKLYHQLKKQRVEQKRLLPRQDVDVDIKILSVLISRLKLRMSNQQKLKDVMRKWKTFHKALASGQGEEHSVAAYNKCREMIIKNLCRNPIKKSNDLLKDKAELLDVVCWISIIQEFERNFLGVQAP